MGGESLDEILAPIRSLRRQIAVLIFGYGGVFTFGFGIDFWLLTFGCGIDVWRSTGGVLKTLSTSCGASPNVDSPSK